MHRCTKCGKVLTRDEIGLHLKVVSRRAESFLCPACLAEKWDVPESEMRDMIERFRRAGCSLFDQKEE